MRQPGLSADEAGAHKSGRFTSPRPGRIMVSSVAGGFSPSHQHAKSVKTSGAAAATGKLPRPRQAEPTPLTSTRLDRILPSARLPKAAGKPQTGIETKSSTHASAHRWAVSSEPVWAKAGPLADAACARAQKDIEASIARGGDVSIKALGELTERLCQVAGAVSPDMFGLLVG
ncbi:MAG TPA: hypothetical protein VLJ86_10905, partial [Ramlibacter sp.]|nr:hypothetical protein [Ramlibacter sp.]